MEWLSEALSFLAGLGVGWSLKIIVDRRSTDSSATSTVQQRNKAGGSIAGRDVKIDQRSDT